MIKVLIKVLLFVTFLCASFSDVLAQQNENATLTIITPTERKIFTRTQLLNMQKISYITMKNSRAYLGIKLDLTVVKLCDILKSFHLNKNDTIELISSDDFSALVPAKIIMQCTRQSSIAYMAIELPWPTLKYNNPDQDSPRHDSAGPFMVVWLHPEKSYISNEYWAWKLVKIKIHRQLDDKIYLSAPPVKDRHIQNGYRSYVSRCLGCHTINHIGKGKIGPDLNQPKSAVDYFKNDEILKQFIRDPQSVRKKSNDRMSGTDEQFLSNKDLDDLVLYLHYMAKH